MSDLLTSVAARKMAARKAAAAKGGTAVCAAVRKPASGMSNPHGERPASPTSSGGGGGGGSTKDRNKLQARNLLLEQTRAAATTPTKPAPTPPSSPAPGQIVLLMGLDEGSELHHLNGKQGVVVGTRCASGLLSPSRIPVQIADEPGAPVHLLDSGSLQLIEEWGEEAEQSCELLGAGEHGTGSSTGAHGPLGVTNPTVRALAEKVANEAAQARLEHAAALAAVAAATADDAALDLSPSSTASMLSPPAVRAQQRDKTHRVISPGFYPTPPESPLEGAGERPVDDAAICNFLDSIHADWSSSAARLRTLLQDGGLAGVSERRIRRIKGGRLGIGSPRLAQPSGGRVSSQANPKISMASLARLTAQDVLITDPGEQRRQCALATGAIPAGRTLATLSGVPFAQCALPKCYSTRCSHCLREATSVQQLQPCPGCMLACYCSVRCRKAALASHAHECKHLADPTSPLSELYLKSTTSPTTCQTGSYDADKGGASATVLDEFVLLCVNVNQ